MRVNTRPGRRRRRLTAALAALVVVGALGVSKTAAAEDGGTSDAPILGIWEVQSLNGVNNNPFSPSAGRAGANYLRIGSARYADGRSAHGLRTQRPQRLQPDLQRQQRQRLLGAWRQSVGIRVGPVPRPHLRSAPGERDHSEHPVQRHRSSRVVPQRSRAWSPSSGRPRHQARVSATPASRSTRSPRSSTPRPSTATPTRGSTGCAAARWTATRTTTVARCCCPATICHDVTAEAMRRPPPPWP